MARPRVDAGGGWPAIRYTLQKAREAGGFLKLYRRMRSKNACKTCALGMGGQKGGMVNERGHFPEVCKKSLQAQVGDMQRPIDADFFRTHSVDELASFTPREMEYAGRLVFPVVHREGTSQFVPIGWDEGLDLVAAALRDAEPDATFFYGSGRSSNEAAFLMQTFARAYGTRNIHNCSCYCHQASGVALGRVVGSGTATVALDDLDKTELALVIGANPASNHPRLITKLVELRRRGGTVIVINPLKELGLVRFRVPSMPGSLLFGSDVASLYLQPHIGSDIALLKALLKALLERDWVDRGFIARHVDGFDEVEADLAESDWETLLHACGVPREQIDRAADALAGARTGIVLWAMGLTHHAHGVDNVIALANLALARGWLGRAGCGLLPIRGHSNVQGVGSVGFTPAVKDAFAARMEEHYGLVAAGKGLDTFGCMEAASAGRIETAVMLGGNLWGSNPDLDWAGEALRRIGTTAYFTTKLNPGHVHGRGRVNLIFPVLARDEERQATTQESMFNFVRYSEGGSEAPASIKSEVEVVCALADRVLPPGPFPFGRMTGHKEIREAIAKIVPGYERIGRIDVHKDEFQIRGRTFHEPDFNTTSGKAQAQVTPLRVIDPGEGRFRLMTLRSEGQFNTVVYEEEDLYRGNTRRDVVMMNGQDAKRLGLEEGAPVTVRTETGCLNVVVSIVELPPGNLAMYYPEANALVPRRVDADSGTPAFKGIVADLLPVGTPALRPSLVVG